MNVRELQEAVYEAQDRFSANLASLQRAEDCNQRVQATLQDAEEEYETARAYRRGIVVRHAYCERQRRHCADHETETAYAYHAEAIARNAMGAAQRKADEAFRSMKAKEAVYNLSYGTLTRLQKRLRELQEEEAANRSGRPPTPPRPGPGHRYQNRPPTPPRPSPRPQNYGSTRPPSPFRPGHDEGRRRQNHGSGRSRSPRAESRNESAAQKPPSTRRFAAWYEETNAACKNPASMREFPQPPSWDCGNVSCRAERPSRALHACKCNLTALFRECPSLKAERVKFHPDKFSRCPADVKQEIQKAAAEVFVIVDQLLQQQR